MLRFKHNISNSDFDIEKGRVTGDDRNERGSFYQGVHSTFFVAYYQERQLDGS